MMYQQSAPFSYTNCVYTHSNDRGMYVKYIFLQNTGNTPRKQHAKMHLYSKENVWNLTRDDHICKWRNWMKSEYAYKCSTCLHSNLPSSRIKTTLSLDSSWIESICGHDISIIHQNQRAIKAYSTTTFLLDGDLTI